MQIFSNEGAAMDSRPILLVEDNPDDILLTRRAFKKVGVANEIVEAVDGVEAMELLSTGRFGGSLPALVLLDLKLPRVDGLEVLKRLRQSDRTKVVRVIVLTSSREESDIHRCALLGANSYIRKPIDFDQFIQAVRQISDYWLQLDESLQEFSA